MFKQSQMTNLQGLELKVHDVFLNASGENVNHCQRRHPAIQY